MEVPNGSITDLCPNRPAACYRKKAAPKKGAAQFR